MIKKILKELINDFYKVTLIRTTIVILRFLFFYKILKKYDSLSDRKEEASNHVTFKKKIDNKEVVHTTLEHNLQFSKNYSNLRKKYMQFNGSKTKLLLSSIQSLDFIDYENFKVLSIGPRNEGELYFIRSLGFRWKNIFSIDLFSYTSRIILSDMHDIKFPDNYFDLIVSGWTLRYSNNRKKALSEIHRVAKNGAVICIGYTYVPKEQRTESNESMDILISNEQILDFYKNDLRDIYFNFNAAKISKLNKRHSIISFRINKK